MIELKKFEFARSRGVIWVCDLANSSKYLNDNQAADDLEEFLQRLYWTSMLMVDAAGGKFIKWTGDGFMAWFETPLHRMLGQQAASVFSAAWHFTFLINVTQLGLKPKRKFGIRHGVTYEQDALIIKIKHSKDYETIDLIGRAAVLAFRLSGVPAKFPNIVTQKDLVIASGEYAETKPHFAKWQVSSEDRLKYFKGEVWGTEAIYASSEKPKKAKSTKGVLKQVKAAIKKAERPSSDPNQEVKFASRFWNNMIVGPDWCREVLNEHARFIKEDLLGNLRLMAEEFEKS